MGSGGKEGVRVALPLKIQAQGAAGYAVSYGGVQVSRKTVVPVRGKEGKADAVFAQDLRLPAALVKGVGAAVELVLPLVFRQDIPSAIQHKGCAADAVCIPAHQSADVCRPLKILPGRTVAQGEGPPIQFNTRDRGAQSHDAHPQPSGINEVFFLTAKVSFDNHICSPLGKNNVQAGKKQEIKTFFDIFLTLVNWPALVYNIASQTRTINFIRRSLCCKTST